MATVQIDALIERFRQSAEQAGATAETVSDETAAMAAVRRLAGEIGAARVAATPQGRRYAPAEAVVGASAAAIADADLGVSVARLAVAETGSLLLGSNVTEDRLVAMLTRTHAVVVDARDVVASLDDATPVLRRLTAPGQEQLRYVGFITGPSRTADIERVLTIGVQGPRALHVIVIGAAS